MTNDEIMALYTAILGRDPSESESIASDGMTPPELRRRLINSPELRGIVAANAFYRKPYEATVFKNSVNTLALATIVKNEEPNIDFMLRSCFPVVDFVAVLDTGSTDATISVAARTLHASGLPYIIKKVQFTNFAEARNLALDAVPAGYSWTLMLDADEQIAPEDYWKLVSLLDADNIEGWALPRYNFPDRAKSLETIAYPDYQRRLIRNRREPPVRFSGAVHEVPATSVRWGYAPLNDKVIDFVGGPYIHHLGQTPMTHERMVEKHNFYTRLSHDGRIGDASGSEPPIIMASRLPPAIGSHYLQPSYSQFGEDRVLAWIFHGKTDGFYVDVGCHHPLRISNTAALHIHSSWTGINIDLDERAIAAFQLHRPGDVNLCTGVGKEVGEAEVYMFEEGAINTMDEGAACDPAWRNIAREKKVVPVQTLASILRAHLPGGRAIDLLTIDAEGRDFDVLQSNDWDLFNPEVILVETSGFSSENPINSFLEERGYKIISHLAVTSVFRKA